MRQAGVVRLFNGRTTQPMLTWRRPWLTEFGSSPASDDVHIDRDGT